MSDTPPPFIYPSPATVIRGTTGYFFAAVACTLAGYSLSQSRGWYFPWDELVKFATFWCILAAGLVAHAALYEQRGMTDSVEPLVKIYARQVPIGALILGCFFGGAFHLWHRGDPAYTAWWSVPVILAALPLNLLSLHRAIRWDSDPKLFTFRSRSYFPALATCLPAFILGHYRETASIPLLVAGLLILVAWFVSLRTSLVVSSLAQAGVLMVAVAVVFFFGGGPLRVCVFGVFLTLAMGVAEAWRVTTRMLGGVEYRPRNPYRRNDSDFFLAATNVATAIFLPLFLTTFLHSQTQLLYFGLVNVLLISGYLGWFIMGRTENYKRWTFVAFFFGISLPIVLAVGAQLRDKVHVPHPHLEALGALLALGMAVLSFAPVTLRLREYIRMARSNNPFEAFTAYFLQVENAVGLTGVISAILATLGLFAVAGVVIADGNSEALDRVNWLVLAYVVFVFVTAFYRWLAGVLKEDADAIQA